MARPQKDGVDYFPVNCQFSDSVKLLRAEFGPVGVGILIALWQRIYGVKGYYTYWDNDVALMFANENGVGVNVVREVVSACIRRGIFDRERFDKYGVLTSEGVQERYAEATERRTSQKIDGRYLLIPMPSNWINVDNNGINVDNNSINDGDNPQSKVNKIKVNNNTYYNNAHTHACESEAVENSSVFLQMPEIHVLKYFKENFPCFDQGVDALTEARKFVAYNAMKNWDCLPDWTKAADLWVARINEKEGGRR